MNQATYDTPDEMSAEMEDLLTLCFALGHATRQVSQFPFEPTTQDLQGISWATHRSLSDWWEGEGFYA